MIPGDTGPAKGWQHQDLLPPQSPSDVVPSEQARRGKGQRQGVAGRPQPRRQLGDVWSKRRSPNGGVTATPTNSAACARAVTRPTPTRAPATVHAGTGDSRMWRSNCFRRQVTRVSAAPKTAKVAIPQDRMPGMRYWMGRVLAASTCWESALKRGRWPVASTLAWAIAAPTMPGWWRRGCRSAAPRTRPPGRGRSQ
jgi:hypothetical protein